MSGNATRPMTSPNTLADGTTLRLAIHAWIRDDAPLAAKLNLLPKHVDELVARIEAALQSAAATKHTRSDGRRSDYEQDDLDRARLHQSFIDDLRLLRAAPVVPEGWRPIETAPKGTDDGTSDRPRILLFPDSWGRPVFGRWNDDRYSTKPRPYWQIEGQSISLSRVVDPTHWMFATAPTPPSQGGR